VLGSGKRARPVTVTMSSQAELMREVCLFFIAARDDLLTVDIESSFRRGRATLKDLFRPYPV
jgi:hypothetical protein